MIVEAVKRVLVTTNHASDLMYTVQSHVLILHVLLESHLKIFRCVSHCLPYNTNRDRMQCRWRFSFHFPDEIYTEKRLRWCLLDESWSASRIVFPRLAEVRCSGMAVKYLDGPFVFKLNDNGAGPHLLVQVMNPFEYMKNWKRKKQINKAILQTFQRPLKILN